MVASAPAINGEFGENYHDQAADMRASGVFQNSATKAPTMTASARTAQSPRGWTFQASRSSSIYGASNTIRPISRQTLLMIRY